MGLGPPVCVYCLRVMDFDPNGAPPWTCECGVNQNSGAGKVTSLLLLSKEDLQEMDLRHGTDCEAWVRELKSG